MHSTNIGKLCISVIKIFVCYIARKMSSLPEAEVWTFCLLYPIVCYNCQYWSSIKYFVCTKVASEDLTITGLGNRDICRQTCNI